MVVIPQSHPEWDRLVCHFHEVKDKLGRTIDPEIFQTVVALNALGIRTTGSCAGHIDEPPRPPWIDIEANIALEEKRAANFTLKAAQEYHHSHLLTHEEIRQLYQEARKPLQALSQRHLALRAKLLDYLEVFYADRVVLAECRLILQGITLQEISETTRLEPQGASLLPLFSPEQQREKIIAYQLEMQSFGAFMTTLFFLR